MKWLETLCKQTHDLLTEAISEVKTGDVTSGESPQRNKGWRSVTAETQNNMNQTLSQNSKAFAVVQKSDQVLRIEN